MTEVVAALIKRKNGEREEFLICQRPEYKARGLLWEFVGGKVEPGETKEEALVRECREELNVTLSVGEPFMDVVHEYPDLTVHLSLFSASIEKGTPELLEHRALAWITPQEIEHYAFCPADVEILSRIRYEDAKQRIKGTYRHFKGNLYRVVGISRDTETMEPYVIYQSEDGSKLWSRPLSSWDQPVNGKERFSRIV